MKKKQTEKADSKEVQKGTKQGRLRIMLHCMGDDKQLSVPILTRNVTVSRGEVG
jgi:hypothetical protein